MCMISLIQHNGMLSGLRVVLPLYHGHRHWWSGRFSSTEPLRDPYLAYKDCAL